MYKLIKNILDSRERNNIVLQKKHQINLHHPQPLTSTQVTNVIYTFGKTRVT